MTKSLRFFESEIQKKSGLTFDVFRPEIRSFILKEMLKKRAKDLNLDMRKYVDYYSRHSSREIPHLLEYTRFHRTSFFRNASTRRQVIRSLTPFFSHVKKSGSKIRILSAGTSAGAEAYSWAIDLTREYPQTDFSILGVDIRKDLVSFASQGVYSASMFKNSQLNLISQGFEPLKDSSESHHWYIAKAQIKNKVKFKTVNLMDRDFFSKNANRFHLILCQNILVYHQQESRKQILENLYRSAVNGAFLVTSRWDKVKSEESSWTLLKSPVFVKKSLAYHR